MRRTTCYEKIKPQTNYYFLTHDYCRDKTPNNHCCCIIALPNNNCVWLFRKLFFQLCQSFVCKEELKRGITITICNKYAPGCDDSKNKECFVITNKCRCMGNVVISHRKQVESFLKPSRGERNWKDKSLKNCALRILSNNLWWMNAWMIKRIPSHN